MPDTKKLSKETFTQAVLRHFDTYIMPEDFGIVKAGIEGLHQDGFPLRDAISYTACFEEVNPSRSEDDALECMAKIRKKYEKQT